MRLNPDENDRKSKLTVLLIVALSLVLAAVAFCFPLGNNSAAETAVSQTGHAQITKEMIAMLDDDPQLKALVEESIALAALQNPDHETNPVQSLEDYYDFLDWSAACMPWNILNGKNPSLYASIDQSLDYFYFLLDQPLPELAGKGYYYPCLEYHEPIASWIRMYCKDWGAFLSTPES